MSEHLPPAEREPETNEQRFIRLSMEGAEQSGFVITDTAARLIAGQVHDGQFSATYSLASTGAIRVDRIEAEASPWLEDPETEPELERMLTHLVRYANWHRDRGPQKRWHLLTTDERIALLLDVFDKE